jgi:hypothetical protein
VHCFQNPLLLGLKGRANETSTHPTSTGLFHVDLIFSRTHRTTNIAEEVSTQMESRQKREQEEVDDFVFD